MTENNPNLQKKQKKNNNYFYLIAFVLTIVAVVLTWTSWAKAKVGITDIFPCVWNIATETLASQGLSIFAFAFFLYAILQSKAFESLFASRRKWLEKRKYFAIGLITIVVALLSSNLSWFDEFVHFYPLVIPLFLAVGFDFFSSLICLYGGSIAGLIGLVSSERMERYFGRCGIGENVKFTGLSGIGFRVLSFVLFTSIVILFNIWYCSRNRKKAVNSNGDLVVKEEVYQPFNKARKIILAVAAVFLLGSVLGQITPVSDQIKKSKITEKIPEQISGSYNETEYKDLGNIGTGGMRIAKVTKEQKSYWGIFGNWKSRAIDCWFIIGGIIICLLAKQGIIETFITAAQNGFPLLIVYILSAVPAEIIKSSGLSNTLAENILPKSTAPGAGFWLLISIFGLSVLFSFLISSTAMTSALVSVSAPALFAISGQTFIYAAIFSWVGGIIGMSFSPGNGILTASLEKIKISYKQFIEKTWLLWLTMLITAFGLISYWAKFIIK